MIPTTVFYGVTGLVMLALVLTVVVRAQYTEKTRDQTFWNRRRFQQMGGPPTPPTCEAIQGIFERGVGYAAQAVEDVKNVNPDTVGTIARTTADSALGAIGSGAPV
jgi:hypothetical protein